MKKIGQLGLLGVILLLVISCSNGLFGTNLFAPFEGEYKMPNIESSEDITEAAEDDRFYEKVQSWEDEEVEKMVKTLDVSATDEKVNPIDRKKAAITAGNVRIASAGAKEAVEEANNFISEYIVEQINKRGKEDEEPQDEDSQFDINRPGATIKKLFKNDVTAEEVERQLSGFYKAKSAFETYGRLLGEDVERQGEPEIPPGVNSGDVAAKALLAGVVSSLVESLKEKSIEEQKKELSDNEAVKELARDIVESLSQEDDSFAEKYGDLGGSSSLEELFGPDLYTVVDSGLDLKALGLEGENNE